MKINCKITHTPFAIEEGDLQFYQKIAPSIGGQTLSIPSPTLCPEERARRRLAFRNERKFYHRKCNSSGKEIISMYSPDKPYNVFSADVWWSDAWDPLNYGREFDFSRPFFEQFDELLRVVPRIALIHRNSQNCDYTNVCADNKNCYILVESSSNEDCYYSYWMQKSINCVDCAFCHECELCYEVTDSQNCYNLRYSANCKNCHDSAFLKNCIACSDCIGCINLHQKQYCVFNEQHTKEEYQQLLESFRLTDYSFVEKVQASAERSHLEYPRKYSEILHSENCNGGYIVDSKDCHLCYHASEARDCRYGVHLWRKSNDNMDVDTVGMNAELNYESINTAINAFHNLFCMRCWTNSNLLYCDNCDYSKNSFGCSGLRKSEYCILNKQYSKADYEKTVVRVISHMQETGEWGEFFPATISPFGYNETVAQEYHPLTKEEALSRDYKWKSEEETSKRKDSGYFIPDSITDVADDITQAVLLCAHSSKPYRIIPPELAAYRKLQVPVPRLSPDVRHADRLKRRNPRSLWPRDCDRCSKAVQSVYELSCKEQIFCEKCYVETVF